MIERLKISGELHVCAGDSGNVNVKTSEEVDPGHGQGEKGMETCEKRTNE